MRPTRLGEPPPVSLLSWSRGGLVNGGYGNGSVMICSFHDIIQRLPLFFSVPLTLQMDNTVISKARHHHRVSFSLLYIKSKGKQGDEKGAK